MIRIMDHHLRSGYPYSGLMWALNIHCCQNGGNISAFLQVEMKMTVYVSVMYYIHKLFRFDFCSFSYDIISNDYKVN